MIRMKNKYPFDFNTCLFSLVTQEEWVNPQDSKYLWALDEGINRITFLLNLPYKEFVSHNAKKDHICVHGCEIKIGHRYYAFGDVFNPHHICVRCMAMILFYSRLTDIKVYQFDTWDEEEGHPIFISKTRMIDNRL